MRALLLAVGGPLGAGVLAATGRFYWHRHLTRREARRGNR